MKENWSRRRFSIVFSGEDNVKQSFSFLVATSKDLLIYKVADMDYRRRDRSIPRGNNGANYKGMRTHFPSLPTYTPDSFSRITSKRSGGNSRRNSREYAFYFTTQTVPRSITKNIEDPRRDFAERRVGRVRHPGTFVEHASWKKDVRSRVWYNHRARFSVRDNGRRLTQRNEDRESCRGNQASNSCFAYILS